MKKVVKKIVNKKANVSKMETVQKSNKSLIYQAKNGAIELRSDLKKGTIWATQAEIVNLFGTNQSVISRHIKNIFEDAEVDGKSNMQKMHIANSDKPVILYSLDIILSVGYRTNSSVAIEFRKWATKTLKEYITKGYVLDRKKISKNYDEFIMSVENIQKLLPDHVILDPKNILELVKEFASTWVSLDAYDKDSLVVSGVTKKSIKLNGVDLSTAIQELRLELMRKGEATEIFAQERNKSSVEGIVGNVMQSFGGNDVYMTLEEKAAHLLYFMVKNHPFVDGNKRSGAFAFVWFLRKFKIKTFKNINPSGLTALTLLIAESNPSRKEQIVALVTQMLK